MDRWLQVLDAPNAVQQAWDRGELSLADVLRVLQSPRTVQKKIVAQLTAGGSPKKVVAQHAAGPPKSIRRIGAAVTSVVQAADRLRESFATDPDARKAGSLQYAGALRQVRSVIDRAIRRLQRSSLNGE